MSYIPLHVHSPFSILDSTASIPKLLKKATELQLQALAITDRGNMHGVVDFFKACKAQKIKPIVGCELWMAPSSRFEKKKQPGIPAATPIVLLAMNDQGYHNLCKLSSIGYLEGFYYYPRIDCETLAKHSEGLICLSGPQRSRISYLASAEKSEELEEELEWYQNVFGDRFYIELQRHQSLTPEKELSETWLQQKKEEYLKRQKTAEQVLLNQCQKQSIEFVAANEVHYIEEEDWKAHEILLNISSGEPCEIWEMDSYGNPRNRTPNPKRDVYPTRQHYFKTPQEMQSLFSDLPQALENTFKIASRCNVELDFKTKHYPVFYPPSVDSSTSKEIREQETQKYLFELCIQGIQNRYSEEKLEKVQEKYPGKNPMEVIKERMNYEFEILSSKGMCDYILIVHDFISWAKSKKIPVGPGRGSAAGSIICYLIGITDIEPLRFNLFFERFINPERVSYPDIDVDICMERRPEVIDYTINKYGKDRVAQIITFGTIKAKMAIKDVGRVLSVPLSKVNKIAKLVPEDPNMTLEKALEIDPELRAFYAEDEEAKRIIDVGKRIEGSVRGTSIHAAGLIISEKTITENIPVCTAKDADMVVTQYSMKPVESVGLLKIDFLGLKTLTSIQKAVDLVAQSHQKQIEWTNLPLEDFNTFQLLNQGKTLGVFQVESAGMQELAKQLHIDYFEEIIAVGALYRPGPMDMIPSFIQRKHGKEEIEIDHPLMKDILSETYGVMVYQEQVMQIASTLAGYTLGEGDILRKAMGKKDHEEMARQKVKFLEGAKKQGIEEETAKKIFGKIEKFASYGFNKSHATAYGYLTFVTAYLKANYPEEWFASLMTCDRDDLTKVAKFIREARTFGIPILPPDVNEAKGEFVATKKGIRFAISAVKGVGEAVVEAIVQERTKNGPFENLSDFISRIDQSKVGKKTIELLINAGAFDFSDWSRDAMRESLDAMFEQISQEKKEEEKGVMNLFSLIEEKKPFSTPPPVKNPMPKLEALHLERELLGFYLTAHPMDEYKNLLKELKCVSLRDFLQTKESLIKSAFIVETVQFKVASKSKKKFAVLSISDGLERFEVPIFHDLYERNLHLLEENKLLFGIFSLDRQEEELKLYLRYLEDLTQIDEDRKKSIQEQFKKFSYKEKKMSQEKNNAPKEKPKNLAIEVKIDQLKMSQVLKMKNLFRKNAGPSKLKIFFKEDLNCYGVLSIDTQWGVNLSQELLYQLKNFPFVSSVEIRNPSE